MKLPYISTKIFYRCYALVLLGIIFSCNSSITNEDVCDQSIDIYPSDSIKNEIIAGFKKYYSDIKNGQILIHQLQKHLSDNDTSHEVVKIKFEKGDFANSRVIFDIIYISKDSIRKSFNGDNLYYLSRENMTLIKWDNNKEILKNNCEYHFKYLPILKPKQFAENILEKGKLEICDSNYIIIYNNVKFYINKVDYSLMRVIENIHYNGELQYLDRRIVNQSFNINLNRWLLNDSHLPKDYCLIDYTSDNPTIYGLTEGSNFKHFEKVDISGRLINTELFQNKVILLDFWYLSCQPCRLSLPMLINLSNIYEDDLIIIGINSVDKDYTIVSEYINRHNITFIQILDLDRSIRDSFDVVLYPTFYLINRNGKVYRTINGFTKDIEKQLITDISSLLS